MLKNTNLIEIKNLKILDELIMKLNKIANIFNKKSDFEKYNYIKRNLL